MAVSEASESWAGKGIVGYSSPMTVAPGEAIRFMVSSAAPTYRFDLVRLWHGDENPAGPGFVEEVVPCAEAGDREGHEQTLVTGSYVEVPDDPALALTRSLTVAAWIFPTTPVKGVAGDLPPDVSPEVAEMFLASAMPPEPQGVMTKWDPDRSHGWGLFVGEEGDLQFWVGNEGDVVRVGTGVPLQASRWYLVSATYDEVARRARVEQRALRPWSGDGSATGEGEAPPPPPTTGIPFVIAGHGAGPRGGGMGNYNGKVDSPRLYGRALDPDRLGALARGQTAAEERDRLVAAWDLGRDPHGATVSDTGPRGLDGRAEQLPARAMTGWNWDGWETDFRRAPHQYGAIHFHDDDLADARWEPGIDMTLPKDLPSGVYAARLRTPDGDEDHVPFFVRPPRGSANAAIAFLAPTNSYLAYANLAASQTWGTVGGPSPDPLEVRLLSLYDVHSDGSGVCYSSRLRPNFKLRPKARLKYPDIPGKYEGVPSYPHQLAADLHLVYWLREKGIEVDVLTDEILDREGLGLLQRYRTIVTGSHPEYWSGSALEALEQYLHGGGRLAYLGGNGFYWVTSTSPDAPHAIEVRRGIAGTRAWQSEPGECHHSTTGELGGLWRHRGRPPQRTVGVGFTAQGVVGAAPFHRTEASRDPAVAWVFDGLAEGHDIIGDHPSTMFPRGAAGFELDRADPALGTPHDAVVLASARSTDLTPSYQHAVEEVLTSDSNQAAPGQSLVRADMTLVRYPNGGAVFSTGSIGWVGALLHDGCDNDVSRITENVLRGFASGRPLDS